MSRGSAGADEEPTAEHRAYGARIDMGGVVHGDAQQAMRDINNHTWNDVRLDPPDAMDELFQGRGVGRLLVALGLIVALAGFAGWMYLIFQGGTSLDDPATDPFSLEIGGLPAPMVAFGAFFAGGIVASIGMGMSKAARERERQRERRRAQALHGRW